MGKGKKLPILGDFCSYAEWNDKVHAPVFTEQKLLAGFVLFFKK